MKKSNIKLMSAILTMTLSGGSFCLTSCGNSEKETSKVESYTFLEDANNIDTILKKSNIKYLIAQLQNYGVSCIYSEELNSLEVTSIAGYNFSDLPERFYTLFNDLLDYTATSHLCCFSKELATNLDLNRLNLTGIKYLSLFGNDNTINYINDSILNMEKLCVLLDETSLTTNKLNLNIQGIENVTILSGNSNVVELGNINFLGAKESELILSGIVITNKTTFNCDNVKVSLTGTIDDSLSLMDLRNVAFDYHDNETDKNISYNPNRSDIDEIIRRINNYNGVKSLKKENME